VCSLQEEAPVQQQGQDLDMCVWHSMPNAWADKGLNEALSQKVQG